MAKAALIPECKKDIGGVKEDICVPTNEKKDGAISLFSRLLRLDTLSKRNTLDSPTASEPQVTYYGVYIPCEIKKGPDEETIHVYTDKLEALELFRRYKSARFKAFRNRQDAVSFALRGAEPVENHEGNGNSIMGEKPYPFKAPSPQDMVALRKSIEAGKMTLVRDKIWDNPRYLVSSGSTPAIVQEGSRYNALHVAAKALNAEICNLILTTVGNPAFIQTLYGMETDQDSCKEFATILLDRYLNTPDKAMNETPLHFAAKFGGEDVVDVLTSFPQCNKLAKNKYGEMAKDIICNRCTSNTEVASRISSLLQDRYYVPVLRTEDGSGAPAIGRPFTPKEPPDLNPDPLSPRYEIFAFAGPMDSNSAEGFRKRWKTPPRGGFRPRDISKGLETVGRNLAEEMHIGWKEYWPFLDTLTDLRSKEGLELLENYLKTKYESACSLAYNESINQSHDNLSMSRISLGNLSHNTPVDTVLSPISELCVAMKTCKLTDGASHWRKGDKMRMIPVNRPITNGDSPQVNHTVSQLLCIERTCQVFAKRISDALIFSLTAEPDVAGDSLKSEAKHLQHTIYTYMDDERFQEINFALIHSRLAQLVVFKLRQKTKELDDVNNLIEFLVKLRCPNDDIFSSDDERKPFYRTNRVRVNHIIDGHVRCVSSFICEELTESDASKGPAVSDNECVEIWEKANKCRCDWKIELFERNSKRNASFRKNRSVLSTSPKSDSFIRRLTYDHDIGDGKLQNSEMEKPLSVNSPAGDNLYTLDVAKCQVIGAEISDDESIASCQSDSEAYATAENDSDDDMQDASDRAVTEPFIYGEEPSEMDRQVYDAVSSCDITSDEYPNVYRWRHTVALYSPAERDSWKTTNLEESVSSVSWTVGESPRANRPRCSTPHKDRDGRDARDYRDTRDSHADKTLPLQVSSWLRVTGPNSPRSTLASKNVNHNVSFGF